ncbi:hypothetical protein GY065_05405 [Snodgrassella sp. ESL0323]|uniref:hypothetical protein n=1 Tax=Snodgrassella sp. ESL0323 TaxID=2705034 RepID=UPI001582951A|nr:hypothetical protein [Snodgrassella sp. ESL0323]NUF78364.1 hypothetical protein [Snodgrassella sp. ESL0323]
MNTIKSVIVPKSTAVVDSERPYSEVMLERTRVDQEAWSETLYLHTPEGLGDLLTSD